MNLSDLLLSFVVRASERTSTAGGTRLTQIQSVHRPLQTWIEQQCRRLSGRMPSKVLARELDDAQVLPILRACLDRCFDGVESVHVNANTGTCLQLRSVQEISGFYRLRYVLLSVCGPGSFSEVEGDELAVIFVLSRLSDAALSDAQFSLAIDHPPESSRQAMHWMAVLLRSVLPETARNLELLARDMPEAARCGFYALPAAAANLHNSLRAGDGDFVRPAPTALYEAWCSSEAGHAVMAVVAAYLMRCYLCAQRLERQLLSFEPTSDWDAESRLLLLARARHLAFTRFALIKNRAVIGTPVLMFYVNVMRRLRLRMFSTELGQLLEHRSSVLEGRNAYLDSTRLRTIQAVLFVATILSLAVGLNAIQMPPFYDANTKNALIRQEFWIVAGTTAVLFALVWGVFNGWRHTRRLWRWLRRQVGST